MDQAIRLFLKESIEMELNVGDLYQLFSAKFPQDRDFWWKISIEEMNHAALIESINDLYLDERILPRDKVEKQAQDLLIMNTSVRQRIELYKLNPPSRSEAFKYGFELENSIGESQFEQFMTGEPDSQVSRIFQKLNGDDVNHALRIEKYMKDNNIV